MQTERFTITSREARLQEALDMTENLGREKGLGKKENLRLRLLAEELIGMMRGITEEAAADYWIEQEGRQYILHLAADVRMNRKMRDQILAVSSSGENAAARGFMGRLKDMIAAAFLPDEYGSTVLTGLSMGLMGMAGNSSPQMQQNSVYALNWSLQRYKSEIEGTEEADQALAELEHSIVASLADDVTASVEGSHVEIAIYKAF